MERAAISNFFLDTFQTGWRRWVAWSICISAILLLGALRISTGAEFAFASLAVLPVLVMAWTAGKTHGLLLALLATAMWTVGDTATGREFSAPWIPWANAVTRWLVYSLVAVLAARVRVQFEREHERATQDALTGLQNRRAFLQAGAIEVERSKRYPHPLAVIYLDLDDFKQINDSRGHDAGDAALRATSGALQSALRSSDRVARMGGDEFAVLLPEIEYQAATDVGRKISSAVNSVLRDFPPVKASIGVAWFGDIDRPFPAMLKAADELMYEAKENGKDAVRSRRYSATQQQDA